MAEYIDREAAVRAIRECAKDAICRYQSRIAPTAVASEIIDVVRDMPAADVVPVVRCNDCKYAYINSFSAASGVALCSSSAKVMQQDDFCSYGERRDGDTDNGV